MQIELPLPQWDKYINISKYWGFENDEFSDRGGSADILFLDDHLHWLMSQTNIIDLGSGIGNMVSQFRKDGLQAQGITYNPNEVIVGKQRFDVDLKWGDIHALPWADDTFDGMLLWDVLEHTVSPYIDLCEARRLCKTGAHGLIFIPGEPWWDCDYHIICPTIRQMQHLCKLSKWQITKLIDKSDVPTNFGMQDQMAVYEIEAV